MDHLLQNAHHWLMEALEVPLFRAGGDAFTLISLAKLVMLAVLVFVVERGVRRLLLQRVLHRTHLSESLQFAIARITGYTFIAFGLYVSCQLVGIDLSSLTIIAGAMGVGLGFGLQNIISNFVSGLIVLIERPISIGDRVEVAGVAGRVARISLRSTTVVTNDNISIIVPNSQFISETVTNWSHGDPKVQVRLPVGIAYGSDVEAFKRAMIEVAAADPAVLREPAPSVYFLAFGDSSLNFEIGVWTETMASTPRRFRSNLNFAIERKLRECGIEIPFPQRDLHVRSGSLVVHTRPAPEERGPPPAGG
jgi:small-conductance mechanosensitive channel